MGCGRWFSPDSHIDSLAQNGIWFSRVMQLCNRAPRASIMTGNTQQDLVLNLLLFLMPKDGSTWLAEEDDSELKAEFKELAMNLPAFMNRVCHLSR